MTAIEIVHLKPKPGAKARLLEIRPQLLAEYRVRYPDVKALLTEAEDGTLFDIWTWEAKALADEALADTSYFPAFQEWETLVDLISVTWTETIEPTGSIGA
ncbi:hypothetical protein [Methylopila sp. M107]|uniref:hypothetical protein n=1 Tax=Methylopila sp. M107 TaxID=1101190 RepID=UPI000367AECF|nr:hypothetical protein [Methylopila sp. M107]